MMEEKSLKFIFIFLSNEKYLHSLYGNEMIVEKIDSS
jgi:hypothetical protein